MKTLQRNLLILLTDVLLLTAFIELLLGRSSDPIILNRYSSLQFGVLIVYSMGVIGWLYFTGLVLLKFETLQAFLSGQRGFGSKYPALFWLVPALLCFLMFALAFLVNQTAPNTVRIPTGVPVALFFLLSFILMRELIAASRVNLALPDVQLISEDSFLNLLLTRLDDLIDPENEKAAFAWAAGLLVIINLALYARMLFDPSRLLGHLDVIRLHYPLELYIAQSMRGGPIPLWNPYLFSGYPLVAHPQSLLFYPVHMILRLLMLPAQTMIGWSIFLHTTIGGIGMYVLCRKFALRPWVAFICGLVFMLNGSFITRILAGHNWLVYALAWLPLLWLFVIKTLEERRASMAVGAAFLLALTLLSGHPTFPAYILMFMGFYWIYDAALLWERDHSLKSILSSALLFSMVVIGGVLLSAVQFVPFASFAGESSLSEGYDLSSADGYALQPVYLLMFFLPDLLAPYYDTYIWEYAPYLGVLFPLMVPFAFSKHEKRRLAGFLGLAAVLSVVLAFGTELKLFSVLYTVVPPFRILRVPGRALVIWIPCIILLGGMGLQALAERRVEERRVAVGIRIYQTLTLLTFGVAVGLLLVQAGFDLKRIGNDNTRIVAVLLAVCAVLFLIQLRIGSWLYAEFAWFGGWTSGVLLVLVSIVMGFLFFLSQVPMGFDLRAGLNMGQLIVYLFLAVAILIGLYKFKGSSFPILLVFITVLLDLAAYGSRYVDGELVPAFSEREVQALALIPEAPAGRFLEGYTPREQNDFMKLGISNVDGYNSGMLAGYSSYLLGVSLPPPPVATSLLPSDSLPEIDRRAMDFLNVTHVLSTYPLEVEGFELAAQTPEYYIYQNTHETSAVTWVDRVEVAQSDDEALEILLSPAFSYDSSVVLNEAVDLAPGPDREASLQITGYDGPAGWMQVETETSREGVLVFSEPYYSERRVWIDGEAAETLRANVGFTAVVLPPGSHVVELRYEPVSLYVGGAISLGTLITCLGVVLLEGVRKRRQGEHSA